MTQEDKKQAEIRAGLDDEVRIVMIKKAGGSNFHRELEASSAEAVIRALAYIICEFSLLTQRPVDAVLGRIATVVLSKADENGIAQ